MIPPCIGSPEVRPRLTVALLGNRGGPGHRGLHMAGSAVESV